MPIYALVCAGPYDTGAGIAPAGSKVNIIELADPTGYTPEDGLTLHPDDGSPAWEPPAVVAVPQMVANADFRAVLLTQFLPDGRSYYTAVDSYLRANQTATAQLPDNDPNKIAAWTAFTRWDMGSFFLRGDPLVAALGGLFHLTSAQMDALFAAAGPPTTGR